MHRQFLVLAGTAAYVCATYTPETLWQPAALQARELLDSPLLYIRGTDAKRGRTGGGDQSDRAGKRGKGGSGNKAPVVKKEDPSSSPPSSPPSSPSAGSWVSSTSGSLASQGSEPYAGSDATNPFRDSGSRSPNREFDSASVRIKAQGPANLRISNSAVDGRITDNSEMSLKKEGTNVRGRIEFPAVAQGGENRIGKTYARGTVVSAALDAREPGSLGGELQVTGRHGYRRKEVAPGQKKKISTNVSRFSHGESKPNQGYGHDGWARAKGITFGGGRLTSSAKFVDMAPDAEGRLRPSGTENDRVPSPEWTADKNRRRP